MRVIKGEFSISLGGTDDNARFDDFEIEVPDDTSVEEIEDILADKWIDFQTNCSEGGWKIDSDEIIEDEKV
jgi:hypothetical protein